MFNQSIRRKIVGIALGLVVLMIGTSILSMLMANRVDHLLDELIKGPGAHQCAIAGARPRAAADGYRQNGNTAG
jgi:hypothetical protein